MIKIAICDDDNVIISQIEKLIVYVSNKSGILIDINIYTNGNELEREVETGERFDVIYLDIHMKNGDGTTIAQNIREIDENVLLIYISRNNRFVIELFKLNVFALITIPIEKQYFENTFLEANRKICKQKLYYTFRYKNNEYKILCIDILYFASNGRQIDINLRNGQSKCFYGKLSDVERWTEGGKIPFLRIHQSYLVNYHHIIARSKSEITLVNGTTLPISESKRKTFNIQYTGLL